ncbi:MAG: hypothetical protein ACR2K6_00955 [Solirubrobacterales bacterium]
MANLTLSINDELLKRARIRALEQDTSVNAVVREHLQRFAGSERSARAVEGFLEIAERAEASSGSGRRRWTREDLYEDRVRSRA